MRLRPYVNETDFEILKNWISDERSHVLWCADRFNYPLESANVETELAFLAENNGETPFAAVSDEGTMVGFFSYSPSSEMNTGYLKFVIVAPEERGKGTAGEMLDLAVQYAFETAKADSVQLSVFTENPRARRCYEKAGFQEIKTDKEAFVYKDELWGRCLMGIEKSSRN